MVVNPLIEKLFCFLKEEDYNLYTYFITYIITKNTTKIIWINEYRTKSTKLRKDSKEQNIRYIVVVHNKPVFEVNHIFNDIIPKIYHTEILETKKKWTTKIHRRRSRTSNKNTEKRTL